MNETGHAIVGGDSHNHAPSMEASTVPMAVAVHRDRIAFAAYKEDTNTIVIDESITTDSDMQGIAERVLMSIRPGLLLLSNKILTDSVLFEALRTPPANPDAGLDGENGVAGENAATSNSFEGSIPYRLMKSSNFDVRNCRAVILKLHVASLSRQPMQYGIHPDHSNRAFPMDSNSGQVFKVSNFHALATVIDFESIAQVQAVGALLFFLQSTMFRFQEGSMSVQDIVRAHSFMHMNVSSDTFTALHIFATERHPLYASKGSGHSKEGFSLFSLLDRTKSRAGRQRLREWMLKPLIDAEIIALRQDGVELFMLPDMQGAVSNIGTLLERIGAVDAILFRIAKCCAKPTDFITLSKALSSAITIIDTLNEDVLWKLKQRVAALSSDSMHGDNSDEFYGAFVSKMLQSCYGEELQNLFERITSIIDEEKTLESKAIAIRPGHHEKLDSLKEQFSNLPTVLSSVAHRLQESIPPLKPYIEVLFIPQIGFLVSLENALDWDEAGTLPEDFRFVFAESGKSYFKNNEVHELDERIGDLDAVCFIQFLRSSKFINCNYDSNIFLYYSIPTQVHQGYGSAYPHRTRGRRHGFRD